MGKSKVTAKCKQHVKKGQLIDVAMTVDTFGFNLRQSMQIYLQNDAAKFHLDPV